MIFYLSQGHRAMSVYSDQQSSHEMPFPRPGAGISALERTAKVRWSSGRGSRGSPPSVKRNYSARKTGVSEALNPTEIEDLLSRPSWSVQSLLPSSSNEWSDRECEGSSSAAGTTMTPQKLRHLLRLCALPPPSSPQQEQEMLADLRGQLHFVRKIQEVDKAQTEPLRSLRDETRAAQREQEVNLESLKDALDNEVVVGRWHPRIRRKERQAMQDSEKNDGKGEKKWDVLVQAPQRVGRYFVVDSGET